MVQSKPLGSSLTARPLAGVPGSAEGLEIVHVRRGRGGARVGRRLDVVNEGRASGLHAARGGSRIALVRRGLARTDDAGRAHVVLVGRRSLIGRGGGGTGVVLVRRRLAPLSAYAGAAGTTIAVAARPQASSRSALRRFSVMRDMTPPLIASGRDCDLTIGSVDLAGRDTVEIRPKAGLTT